MAWGDKEWRKVKEIEDRINTAPDETKKTDTTPVAPQPVISDVGKEKGALVIDRPSISQLSSPQEPPKEQVKSVPVPETPDLSALKINNPPPKQPDDKQQKTPIMSSKERYAEYMRGYMAGRKAHDAKPDKKAPQGRKRKV